MKFDAPSEETKYLIDPDKVDSDDYDEICREVARAVLAVHPRATVEIEADASSFVLRAQDPEIAEAFERLLDAGLSISWMTIFGHRIAQKDGLGRVRASPTVLADVFTIFSFCYELEFLDGNDEPLVQYYEQAYGCSFWLPSSKLTQILQRLDDEAASVVVSVDDWLVEENEPS